MTLADLASKKCGPCGGIDPMRVEEANRSLADLPGWTLKQDSIEKEFRFKSYMDGLDFAYLVGKIAEMENHHPELVVRWKRVRVTLSTHAIKGLSLNDFIMAAKTEMEYAKLKR